MKSKVSRKALSPKTLPKKLTKKASNARAKTTVVSDQFAVQPTVATGVGAVSASLTEAGLDAPTAEWMPLIPSGVMVMPGSARPVFLLKHEASGDTLPVWMHPLDASVALQELGQGELGSPHAVTRQILGRLGITHGRCYFVDRVGHHQYALLHLTTAAGLELPGGAIRVRADEVISFCLALKVLFFSTKEFIAQCRVLNQELEKLQEGLLTGTAGEAFPDLEIDSKKTGYMM
ncbi:MAG: hypothetical protein J0L82_14820 [Deltaproteobacteria bacterium]|nr:hypothetical protein [Deltaproteobacteria bacterium]